MLKIYVTSLVCCALLAAPTVRAQDWVQKLQDPTTNFYEVQRAFNSHWQDRPYERGKGWKQFKRIEYMMEPRVYPSGDRALGTPSKAYEEFRKYEQGRANARTTGTTANWSFIGPSAVPASGGGAGRVNFVRFHPTNTSIMWVGSPGGGLWKSTNGGTSWSSNTDNLTVLGATDLLIDPTNTNVMYLATGDGESTDTRSIGVLKSTDGGTTWNTTGLTWTVSQGRTISKLLMHPTNSSIILAASSAGVWRSQDAGATWVQESTFSCKDIEFKPGDPTIVYAAGSSFYRSTDTGDTFTLVSTGIPTGNNRIAIGVTAANAGYVYLLCGKSSDSGFNGLVRSTDSGLTFTSRSTTPNILGWQANGSDAGGQSWYDLSIAVSPTNAEEVITGGVNVWRSTNGGSTWAINGHWTGTTASYIHADIHALEFLPGSGTTYFAGCDGGIFKKTSTTSWADISANLQIAQLYKLGQSATTSNLILSGWQDNGTNRWNGTGWTRVYGGDGMECFIDRTSNSYMYAELYNGDFKRSADGGSTWTGIKPSAAGSGDWVTPWCQDPNTAATLYAGFAQIWKSTDRGTTWSQLGTITGTTNFKSLAVAPSNSSVIYAGRPTQLWKTTNGGSTWTSITTGLPVSSAQITYITVHPTDANRLWVTFSGYSSANKVFTSADGGTTWTNYSTGLPNLPVNCVVYEKNTTDRVYVGTDVGVYVRDNSLTGWQPYYTGLPNVIVTELEIFYGSPNKLRAATYGRGLWESDLFTPCVANFSATASASPATICPGGSTALNVVVSTNTPGTYCASNATNTADTDIGNVTFAGINNGTASPGTGNTTANQTYNNYTTTVAAAQVTQGSSYPFSMSQITSGTTWYGGYCKVFIDFNFDGDFDDAGENVFSAGPTSAAAPTLSGTIAIPAVTNRGTTRLRVVLRESGTATSTVPCGTFSYGETEDYAINITGSSNGSYTYSWSPTTGLSNATVANPTASPGSTTAYTCRVSSSAFCSVSPSTTVTVTGSSALPLADVTFTSFTGSDLATVHPGWKEASGVIPAGTTSSWLQCNATQETAFGTRTARINLYTTSRREWIISPLFTATATTVLDYSVAVTDWNYATADAMGSDDKVQVMVSTDCGQSWTALQTYNAASNLSNTLTAQSVSLGAYAGQSVQVAFFAQDGPVDDTNDYDFHVDNIRVYNSAGISTPVVQAAMREAAPSFGAAVYPNPFSQAPVLHLELPAEARVRLTITDAVGRVVHQHSSVLPAGAADLALTEAASLSKGLYQLTVEANGQRQQLKLMKE